MTDPGRFDMVASMVASPDGQWVHVSELESPPVVPDGWEVDPFGFDGWWLCDERCPVLEVTAGGVVAASVDKPVPWEAVSALHWAAKHNKRPPHAKDLTPEQWAALGSALAAAPPAEVAPIGNDEPEPFL